LKQKIKILKYELLNVTSKLKIKEDLLNQKINENMELRDKIKSRNLSITS